MARSALGNYEEAIGDLDRSLALQPDNSVALITKEPAHVALDDYERAIEDFGALLEMEPDHTLARSAKAFECIECGQFNEAVQGFDRLIKLVPETPIPNTAGPAPTLIWTDPAWRLRNSAGPSTWTRVTSNPCSTGPLPI